MNQEKIGKLIAKRRKELNLTQSELGAKVGVGDRAVSKWECGITCPDISIINDLSKVLGITSDELLKGELNHSHKKPKFNKSLLLIIMIAITIIILALITYQNRSSVYSIKSTDSSYIVTGKIVFEKNIATVIINQLGFKNRECNKMHIKNYEYAIRYNKEFIIRNGYIDEDGFGFEPVTVKEFMKNFSINYQIDKKLEKKPIIKNGLVLEITFLDVDNNKHKEIINLELGK